MNSKHSTIRDTAILVLLLASLAYAQERKTPEFWPAHLANVTTTAADGYLSARYNYTRTGGPCYEKNRTPIGLFNFADERGGFKTGKYIAVNTAVTVGTFGFGLYARHRYRKGGSKFWRWAASGPAAGLALGHGMESSIWITNCTL